VSAPPSSGQAVARTGSPSAARHGWVQAAATVLAGVIVMGVLAALGLWAAGGAGIPDNGFPRVVAATVVMAGGGSVKLAGDAGALADTRAGLTAMPLSVTLAGALVIAAGFLRPLRHGAMAGASELAGWAARIAVLWLAALVGLALAARQTFTVPLGNGTIGDIGDLFGVNPRIGYTTDLAPTVLFGFLWLAGVLVLALLASRGAPLPARLLRRQESVRPAAYAMVALLLACVCVGVVIGLVVAATRGHPARTLAVVLLALPNVIWPAFTIGLGATWNGRVDGPFGLPMPHLLDQVLRAPDVSTLDLHSLAQYDGRVWWLVAADAVLTVGAAFTMEARSPARIRPWRHAVHMALALVAAVLTICLVCRISAHYGLSLIGIGDLGGGLSGVLFLEPRLWSALGLAALWGLVTGFAGGLLATRVRPRAEVP
jgi:hypothetical protein